MSVDAKVFIFERKDGRLLLLNAYEGTSPDIVLKLYVNWYNKDFSIENDLAYIKTSDFTFVRKSFCFDFYKESMEIKKNA